MSAGSYDGERMIARRRRASQSGIPVPPVIADKSAREITFDAARAYYPMQTFTFSAIPREVYGFWMKPETRWPLNSVMASASL